MNNIAEISCIVPLVLFVVLSYVKEKRKKNVWNSLWRGRVK